MLIAYIICLYLLSSCRISICTLAVFSGIPEITKDSASENYSEEDDPTRRGRGMAQGQHYGYRGDPYAPRTPEAHRAGKPGPGPSRPQDPYYDQTGI